MPGKPEDDNTQKRKWDKEVRKILVVLTNSGKQKKPKGKTTTAGDPGE